MRSAHWLRGMSAMRCPTDIICLDTETHHSTESTDTVAYHTLTLGHALAYRLDAGRRTRQKRFDFTTINEWWTWLANNLRANRTTFVFGHNLGYDLGILDAWYRFRCSEWSFYRVAVDKNILFIDALLHGKHVLFIDTTNYWKCSLDVIAKSLGMEKEELPDTSVPSEDLWRRCRQDVNILARAVDTLITWIMANDYGPFTVSIAGLAMNTFKKQFLSTSILVHDNPEAIEMERNAYFGGAVDTPFIGTSHENPVYECDVISMYPSCCLQPLPKMLRRIERFPTLERLRNIAETDMLIGDVVLQTDVPMYPFWTEQGIIYPVGTFATYLADAELQHAIRHNHVKTCNRVACYDSEPFARDYMIHFIDQKQNARGLGNEMHETLCKYFINGWYGKTGQLTPKWYPITKDSLAYACDYYKLPPGYLNWMMKKPFLLDCIEKPLIIPEYNVVIMQRQLWQDVEIQIGEQETRDSCPSIAACVTSLARVKLRSLQAVCGPRGFLYSDTDSLWAGQRALDCLLEANAIGDNVGQLQIKGVCDSLTVYGRKDYVATNYKKLEGPNVVKQYDELLKRKGIRLDAVLQPDGRYEQERWDRPITQIKNGQRGQVTVTKILKTLHRNITHCSVGNDGWTSPIIMG